MRWRLVLPLGALPILLALQAKSAYQFGTATHSFSCSTQPGWCYHSTILASSPKDALPAATDCCSACSTVPLCKAWVFVESSTNTKAPAGTCHLFGNTVVNRSKSTAGLNCTSGLAGPQQLHLGTFLLADGDTMEHMDAGIVAAVQRPIKRSPTAPLIGPDYPWEGTMHFYGSVVTLAPDDHRIYYACNVKGRKQGAADDRSSCCVAVSSDGNTWKKPMLSYISFNSSFPKTNMVFTSGAGWFDSMLALPQGMPAPRGTPAGTRLIMAFDDGLTDAKERSLQLAVSADGFKFTRLSPPPQQLPANFADTSVSLSFDPLTSEFVALGRMDGAPNQHPNQVCGDFPPPANWNMHSVRGVRRAVSMPELDGHRLLPSLHNWLNASRLLPFSFDRLDEQCLDIYNTAATLVSTGLLNNSLSAELNYERAFLAFPSVYLHYGQEENNGVLDVRFAFSRDGMKFRYISGDRRAFIPRGFGAPHLSDSLRLQPSLFTEADDGVAARWDSAITYAYRGIVDHPSDGTQSLYYFGQQGTHAHQNPSTRGQFGIGQLSIIRDRWIALGADIPFASASSNGSTQPLHMLTKPMMLPQCLSAAHALRMTLNADVSVGGNLSLAILDGDSKQALAGFGHNECTPIVGNRLAAPLRFGNTHNLGPLAARSIQLEFRLRPPARLFAWRLRCE